MGGGDSWNREKLRVIKTLRRSLAVRSRDYYQLFLIDE